MQCLQWHVFWASILLTGICMYCIIFFILFFLILGATVGIMENVDRQHAFISNKPQLIDHSPLVIFTIVRWNSKFYEYYLLQKYFITFHIQWVFRSCSYNLFHWVPVGILYTSDPPFYTWLLQFSTHVDSFDFPYHASACRIHNARIFQCWLRFRMSAVQQS